MRQQQAAEQYVEQQKTNNENEENIRRYKNPLYAGTDKGGGTKKKTAVKLHSMDVEKFEKSPQRHHHMSARSDSPNDSNDWKETSLPQKTKKKDINIELSRTRAARAAERELAHREFLEIQKTLGEELEREVMV